MENKKKIEDNKKEIDEISKALDELNNDQFYLQNLLSKATLENRQILEEQISDLERKIFELQQRLNSLSIIQTELIKKTDEELDKEEEDKPNMLILGLMWLTGVGGFLREAFKRIANIELASFKTLAFGCVINLFVLAICFVIIGIAAKNIFTGTSTEDNLVNILDKFADLPQDEAFSCNTTENVQERTGNPNLTPSCT